MAIADVATELSVPERTVAWWRSVHFARGHFYTFTTNPSEDSPMSTTQQATATNPWDGKTLLFRANNPALPGQVYVRPVDGSAPESALRSETVGSRYRVAARTATSDATGNDFPLHFEDDTDGPVCLETDAALFAVATAHPGEDVAAPPRGVSAEIVKPLEPDAPAGPKNDPTNSGIPSAPAPAVQKEEQESPEVDAREDAWHRSLELIETVEHRLNMVSRHVGHAIVADGRNALNELRKLLGHAHV